MKIANKPILKLALTALLSVVSVMVWSDSLEKLQELEAEIEKIEQDIKAAEAAEAKRKAEALARKQAEEQKRKEQAEKRKAEELARKQAEEQKRKQQEAQRIAEEKRRAEEAARKQAEAEAQRKAEAAARKKAELLALVGEMVEIPAGSFQMGSNEGDDDEQPVHGVNLPAFKIGKFEVTVGQFRKFVEASAYRTDAEQNTGGNEGCYAYKGGDDFGWQAGTNWRDPGYQQSDNHPVVCVSWNDANAYIDWLNRETAANFRLPSEAQWEYAVRSGSTSQYYFGNSGDSLCNFGNIADESAKQHFSGWSVDSCNDGAVFTAEVGRYYANAFGLYDMSGNVWEWTQDCWNNSYNGAPVNGSAWNSGDCSKRVLRGGSWLNIAPWPRSANRSLSPRDYRDLNIGFRLAKD